MAILPLDDPYLLYTMTREQRSCASSGVALKSPHEKLKRCARVEKVYYGRGSHRVPFVPVQIDSALPKPTGVLVCEYRTNISGVLQAPRKKITYVPSLLPTTLYKVYCLSLDNRFTFIDFKPNNLSSVLRRI